jgi:hypothetical protein
MSYERATALFETMAQGIVKSAGSRCGPAIAANEIAPMRNAM